MAFDGNGRRSHGSHRGCRGSGRSRVSADGGCDDIRDMEPVDVPSRVGYSLSDDISDAISDGTEVLYRTDVMDDGILIPDVDSAVTYVHGEHAIGHDTCVVMDGILVRWDEDADCARRKMHGGGDPTCEPAAR